MEGLAVTPLHLSGLGDLITTATSTGSHHHELGRKLVRGELDDISGEGIHTLEMVDKYKLFDTSAYPLYTLIHTIIREPDGISRQLHDYLDNIC